MSHGVMVIKAQIRVTKKTWPRENTSTPREDKSSSEKAKMRHKNTSLDPLIVPRELDWQHKTDTAQCLWLLWQMKIQGPSINEKIITDKLLMAKNNRGTENDRRMMSRKGHAQHEHEQSIKMDHFSKSVAVKLPIFSDQFLIYIKMVPNVKCKVVMCCQQSSNSDGPK